MNSKYLSKDTVGKCADFDRAMYVCMHLYSGDVEKKQIIQLVNKKIINTLISGKKSK